MSKLPEHIEHWIEDNNIGGGCQEHDPCLMQRDTVCTDSLRAFLSTLPLVPDGHVVVPVELLELLIEASRAEINSEGLERARGAVKALLTAQRSGK